MKLTNKGKWWLSIVTLMVVLLSGYEAYGWSAVPKLNKPVRSVPQMRGTARKAPARLAISQSGGIQLSASDLEGLPEDYVSYYAGNNEYGIMNEAWGDLWYENNALYFGSDNGLLLYKYDTNTEEYQEINRTVVKFVDNAVPDGTSLLLYTWSEDEDAAWTLIAELFVQNNRIEWDCPILYPVLYNTSSVDLPIEWISMDYEDESGSTGNNVNITFEPGPCNFFNPISVSISTEEGYEIRYTVDGTVPTVQSAVYTAPIYIDKTTTIRAIAIDGEGNASNVRSAAYGCTKHGIGEGYDPNSPPDPNAPVTKYKLTVASNPSGAGYVNYNGTYSFAPGETIDLYTYSYGDFTFKHWLYDGEPYSSDSNIRLEMPEKDVVMIADYDWTPSNPADPEFTQFSHPVTVMCEPSGAGYSNIYETDVLEGDSIDIWAYNHTNFRFREWKVDGKSAGNSNPIWVTMGKRPISVVSYYDYVPVNPQNPGANYWNPTTGQVIIDSFEPGSLWDAMYNLLGWDNFPLVNSMIVKGVVGNNDLYAFNSGYLENLSTLDLSRVSGLTNLPSYGFEGMSCTSIYLPSTIEYVGAYEFSGSSQLNTINLYSVVPPACHNNAFGGIDVSVITLRVPLESVSLYENDENWSQFTIMPLADDTHALQVNLPDDGIDGRYKNYRLELVNTSTGSRQKYVVTDRQTYTFIDLLKDEQFNVYLYSQNGLLIGSLTEITMSDQDMSVTLADLKQVRNVRALVTAPDGANLTDQVEVEWLEVKTDGTTAYLRKTADLGEVPVGQKLVCRVTLPRQLGIVYANPTERELTIDANSSAVTIQLEPLREISLSGRVVDEDGKALNAANVSINAMLNGKYSTNYAARTDRNGAWSTTVLEAPAYMFTYSANECVNVADTIKSVGADVSQIEVPAVSLRSIASARVQYAFTYTAATKASETPTTEDHYSDYRNVNITAYNLTQGRALSNLSQQYPTLVILDEATEAGDSLLLTAKSTNGAFNPVECRLALDENMRAEASFAIVGKGGVTASFAMTENPAVIAMLYNANGNHVSTADYNEAKVTFSGLDKGKYSLVTIGKSSLLNGVQRLDMLTEVGLTEDADYVRDEFEVSEGVISEIKNDLIPPFDENRFRYTSSNSLFGVNKTSVVPGNYVTLKSNVDFKKAYKASVEDVKMIYHLPENCELVANSVMRGNTVVPYQQDDNKVVVPLGNNYTEQIRFVVIPTEGGESTPTASVSFAYDGKEIVQPLGSAQFSVKSLTINVPSTITSDIASVRGLCPAKSKVKVYDGTDLIGETEALQNGQWSVDCKINSAYNLSNHVIHAEFTTPAGLQLISESKTAVVDKNTIEPKTVTMSFYNGWLRREISVVFDFENKTTSESSYMFYTQTDLTFVADLTNNSPDCVSAVTLNVFTDRKEKVEIPLTYDANMDRWIGVKSFSASNLPVNMSININGSYAIEHDRTLMTELVNDWDAQKALAQETIDELNEAETQSANDVEQLENQQAANDAVIAQIENGYSQGITDAELDPLYAALELDVNAMQPSVPDDADLEWLNTMLDYGDALLADEIIAEIDEATINALLSYVDNMLTEESLDVVGSLETIIQEKVVFEDADGNEAQFYRVKPSQLSAELIENADTTILEMTEGAALKILINAENGTTVIIDEYADVATVMISKSVASQVMAIIRKASSSDNFVDAVNRAITDINRLVSSLTGAVSGMLSDLNDKLKNLKATIADVEAQKAIVAGRSAGMRMRQADIEKQLRTLRNQNVVDINEFSRLKAQISELEKSRSALLKEIKSLDAVEDNLSKRLMKMRPKLLAATAGLAKLNELWGVVQSIYSLINHGVVAIQDHSRWFSLINAIEPCEADALRAAALVAACKSDWSCLAWQKGYYPSLAISAIAATVNGVLFTQSNIKFLAGFIIGVINDFVNGVADEMYVNATTASAQWYPKRYNEYKSLKCTEKKEPTPTEPKPNWPRNNDGDNGKGNNEGDFDPISPIHDPAGYVYEAVESNRVQGVQVTCYYKETLEDMYGDPYEQVVLWNAEEYAQKNPLFTDEYGMYQWDVPQGLWQARFEKDGYVSTQSDWLPVPPPQLEVNVPMVQNSQPEVVDAHAYETGIQFVFDKYMDPNTISASTVFLKVGDNVVGGEVAIIDETASDPKNEESKKYATTFRFIPEEPLSMSQGEIRLTISRQVKSYAGIPMASNFTQVFDIEKEITEILADDMRVLYGADKELVINALPFDAAVGKTLKIRNSSPSLISIDREEVEIDDNGQAKINVSGMLPGQAVLEFSVDDVYATGEAQIYVVTELYDIDKPVASRASGTEVYKGTKVTLTTAVPNATIYYTTDGSCPCDVDGTRMKYVVPIEITEPIDIKALVVTTANEESETAEFSYTIKSNNVDYSLGEGWTWISHNFDNPVQTSVFASNESVKSIVSQTSEAVRDPQLGFVGGLKQLETNQTYKVESASALALRLSDFARDPSKAIAVKKGWNWLGYTSGQTMSVQEAFAQTEVAALDYIVGQKGFTQYDGTEWVGSLETLVPGCGYLYFSQDNKNIVYNTSIVSNAASLHAQVMTNSTPWAVEINKYPQIMCLVLKLHSADGEALDAAHYSVGAFCGTECRGIGKKVGDKVMLSVYGNAGDKINIKVMPADGDNAIDAKLSFDLSETMMGNVIDPYILNIDDNLTDGVNTVGSGACKTRVEGRRLFIDGATDSIERVQLINMEGISVLSAHKVDATGISLANLVAGVYAVVVVDSNGYSYYKVVVK